MLDQLETTVSSHSLIGQTREEDSCDAHLLSNLAECSTAPTRDSPKGRPQELLELLCKVVGVCRGGVAHLSAEGELIEHITYGLSEEAKAQTWQSSGIVEIVRFVGRRSGPVRLKNLASALPRLELPASIEATGSFLGLTLTTFGRSRGALYLFREPTEPAFGKDEEEMALMIGSWLEKGGQYEESRMLAQVNLLNRLTQEAAGNPNLSRILKVALRELDRHLPLNITAVWLAEEKPTRGVILEAVSEGTMGWRSFVSPASSEGLLGLQGSMRLPLGETPFGTCLDDGQAHYADLEQVGERLTPLAERLAANGATSYFAVPLRAGERVVGILQSVSTRPAGFTRDQIQLLYLVSDVLGPAISNCQLFGRLRTAYEELRMTQTQLIQAEKLRALGELAGGMAHEFNNALCGALGFLELALGNKTLDPGSRGYLESARTCALDAAQTVRRVQDFARQRRSDMQVQPLDINELVKQTIELTRPRWELPRQSNGAVITVEAQMEATAWVSGGPAELREVLTNLIFNAIDAMLDGGTITIRTWDAPPISPPVEQNDNVGWVFFSVQDTGVGITEEVRARLFEPFFTTKEERGNGLGLSVAFGIISRHEGKITVDSRPGHGATFTVALPAVPPQNEEDKETGRQGDKETRRQGDKETERQGRKESGAREHRETDASGAENASPCHLVTLSPCHPVSSPGNPASNGLRLLVIEDEESVRRFLEVSLARLGHRPLVAADAQQGLAAFAAEQFDAVLTDLGLPDIDGKEVARTIARKSPDTPVILLTGWADQLNADKEVIEGVTKVLGKPVAIETLGSTLASICPQNSVLRTL